MLKKAKKEKYPSLILREVPDMPSLIFCETDARNTLLMY
jgi:hypothetical protein